MDHADPFQSLFRIANYSFLAYAVKSALPTVVDDADRRVMAIFNDLYQRERHYVVRCHELMGESGRYPSTQTFDLNTSFYNFVQPIALARHYGAAVSRELAGLKAIRSQVSTADPLHAKLARLVDDFVAIREEGRAKVAEVVASATPPPSAKPAPAATATAKPSAGPA